MMAADAIGPVGVMMATLDAATDFGWVQISGKAIGNCLTGFADNGKVYATATAGSIDDASVAGDLVVNAKGASAIDTLQAEATTVIVFSTLAFAVTATLWLGVLAWLGRHSGG